MRSDTAPAPKRREADPTPLFLAALTAGALLTIGVVAHFFLVIAIASSKGAFWRFVVADAAFASLPTMAAVFFAADAVRAQA